MQWMRRIAPIVIGAAALIAMALGPAAAAQSGLAPVLDLNGDGPGQDYATTFTEDGGPQLVVDAGGLLVTDPDSESLVWAKAVLVNRPDQAVESLAANPGATGITARYSSETGELLLKGPASPADFQQVLRTLTYHNTSHAPDIEERAIVITARDGTYTSRPVTSTVAINAVNDAPVLDASGLMTLADVLSGDTNPFGSRVAAVIASAETNGEDRITDVDRNALEGIAVIEVGSSNGRWQYSTTAGAAWLDFGAVSNTAAVLLNPEARIRFVPVPGYSGTAAITFRAWDQTQGQNGATGVDVSVNGGVSAFSVAAETAIVNVVVAAAAPLVDLNGDAPGRDYAVAFPTGSPPLPIAASDATVVDADDGLLSQLVVTLPARPDGAAESLSADSLTTAITVSAYNATTGVLRLVGPDTPANFERVLKTVRYHNAAASPTPQPRTIRAVADDGKVAGPAALSTIDVVTRNSAPLLAPSTVINAGDQPEDAEPAGRTVTELLASAGDPISDPDPGAAAGIAVVGVDVTHGTWQYSRGSAESPAWRPFAAVSPEAATLLAATTRLRFLPAADYNGPADALSFRAWDQTSGGDGQTGVNTLVNGGATAFSEAVGVLTMTVVPVNDPPRLTAAPAVLTYTEDGPDLPIFDATLSITDVDDALVSWATLVLVTPPDGASEQVLVDVEGSGLTGTFSEGGLRLEGAAAPAVYEAVLRTAHYRHVSEDPTPGPRTVRLVVADALQQSLPLDQTVTVSPVNDPPVVDLNGPATGTGHATDYFIGWGPVRISGREPTISDPDDDTLSAVTVTITNLPDSPHELLDAAIYANFNIRKRYDAATGTLTLEGRAGLRDYEAVLRTVVYRHDLIAPNRTDRLLEVRVSDGETESLPAISTVRISPAPRARAFLALVGRRSEEPNDRCQEAFEMATNRTEQFLPDDVNDWFTFVTAAAGDVVVELQDFSPAAGQLLVAGGPRCGELTLLGNNGDDNPTKIVRLGRLAAGRYYIWLINDGVLSTIPYRLRVTVTR